MSIGQSMVGGALSDGQLKNVNYIRECQVFWQYFLSGIVAVLIFSSTYSWEFSP